MSAAGLSGHLIQKFEENGLLETVTQGSMSFAPKMHGSLPPVKQEMSETTAFNITTLQSKLNQKMGPEFVSQRQGPGGGKLTYAEGWKIINLANDIFGFNGWSSNIISLTTDFIDFNEEARRYSVGVTAIMRVTLADGIFHEDIGYGMIDGAKSKGAALDKCKKEAVTDGLKRSFRNFGNLLGNCLYDKTYTAEIVKMKVQPTKLNKQDLYRHVDFAEPAAVDSKANIKVVTATSNSSASSTTTSSTKAPTAIPAHVRPENCVQTTPDNKSVASKGRLSAIATGLNTPITTPAGRAMNMPAPAPQAKPVHTRTVAFAQGLVTPNQTIISDTSGNTSSATADDDDTSYFQSDDDAFLAAIDLGDGDLGQPIDFEEGTMETLMEQDDEAVVVKLDPSEYERKRIMEQQKQQNRGPPIQNAPQQLQQTNHQRMTPNQQQQQQRSAQSTSSTRFPQTNNRIAETSAPPLIDKPNAPVSTPVFSGSFKFPPQAANGAIPQIQRQRQPYSVGQKRPAEVMQPARRPAQGMGLSASHQHAGVSMHRQPLGALDVPSDGGDIKRVRR